MTKKATLGGLVKGQPAAKKLKALRQREAERRARTHAQVEAWFEEFDENKDGKLQRDELRALLAWLHPSRPPSEKNLDYLIERATAVESHTMRLSGNKDGSVAWHDARQTVLWYADYCKDQSYIDSVFRRFDDDNSGTLEASELINVLRAVAPEGLAVDEADVTYVLEQFDDNADGVIDRKELLPMLAKWAQVAYTKLEQSKHDEAQRETTVARSWGKIKETVAPVGEAGAAVGLSLVKVAQLARQRERVQIRSKWQLAADSATGSAGGGSGGGAGVGSKGKAILRLVAAARQQQEIEDQAERAVAMPLLQRLKAARAASDAASDAEASTWQPAAPAASEGKLLLQSVSEESLPSIAVQPAVVATHAPVAAPAKAAEPAAPLSVGFSRFDTSVAGDRDGPWQPTDHKLMRTHTKMLKRAETRLEMELGIPLEVVVAPTPKAAARAAKVGAPVQEGGPSKGSSMCVIL